MLGSFVWRRRRARLVCAPCPRRCPRATPHRLYRRLRPHHLPLRSSRRCPTCSSLRGAFAVCAGAERDRRQLDRLPGRHWQCAGPLASLLSTSARCGALQGRAVAHRDPDWPGADLDRPCRGERDGRGRRGRAQSRCRRNHRGDSSRVLHDSVESAVDFCSRGAHWALGLL